MRTDLYQEMYCQEEYYWWHKAKRKLVKSFLPSKKNLTILDIGCGTGKLLEELQTKGTVWGIDQNQEAVDFCRNRGLKRVAKAKFPGFRVNTKFDVITCLDVLEHIKDDAASLENIAQLLKPKGRLILTVPAHQWLYSYWDKILHHHRRYSKDKLRQVVEKSHLKIVKLSFIYSFLLPPVVLFRLVRQKLFATRPPSSDFIDLPRSIHAALLTMALCEQFLLQYINIPTGLSLLCVAEKN